VSYFKTTRGWQDSDFFGENVEFSERDAWIWMIGEAQWKDGTVNVLGKPVFLKRGQFSASIRFMSQKFGWSKDRVSRFLKRAEIWDMIASESATGQKIITICNYEKYQNVDQVDKDAPKDTNKDRVEDAPKDKLEEGKEVKKVKKKKEGAVAPEKPETVSFEIWRDFKKQRKTPLTPTALARIEREVAKAGITVEAGLRMAVERGWQSFKAEWINTNEGNGNAKFGSNQQKPNGKSQQVRDILADELEKSFRRDGQEGFGSPRIPSV